MHQVQLRPLAKIVVLGLLLCNCAFDAIRPGAQDVAAAPPPARPMQANAVVAAKGVVVPLREADLSFKASGRVQEILVAEGETVTAGQELARLETRDLEQAVRQAESRLKSAEAELTKARAGARPEEIAAAEAALAIAQAGAKSAENAVAIAKGDLASAQANLTAANSAVGTAQTILSAAQAALSSVQASLQRLLAGATQREIEIAEKQVEVAGAELWALQRKRDEDIYGLEGEIAAAEAKLEIARLQLAQLQDPPRPEDVAIARADIARGQARVQTSRAELTRARTKVLQAQAGVQTVQAQLAQAGAEVESAQARAAQVEAERDLVKAGSRAEDIAIAEAAVAQAEAALAAAQNDLEDAVLRAPFSGTIGAILVDEGERVQPLTTIMRLGDLSQLRVETEDLSEVDVDQVQLGQKAIVTVDALGGERFDGVVAQIAPMASDYHGATVYTVTVDLGVGPESGLRWGMSTFVEIEVE